MILGRNDGIDFGDNIDSGDSIDFGENIESSVDYGDSIDFGDNIDYGDEQTIDFGDNDISSEIKIEEGMVYTHVVCSNVIKRMLSYIVHIV